MGKVKGTKNKKSLEERFMEKVIIDNKTMCWNFQNKTSNPGFHVDIGVKKNVRHVSWFLSGKGFGDGVLEVLCGNKFCVNPEHLLLISSWEERFWRYTDKKSDAECWNWLAKKDKKGYGILHVDRNTRAHRMSWVIHNGEIPSGMLVCHKCDNPGCVNPNHLFLGTAKDNNLDKVYKGRHKGARGERNFGAILNEKQVKAIRFLFRSKKFSTYDLSDIFMVSRNCISRIINNITWRYME